MTDRFSNRNPSLTAPAASAYPITPNDAVDLAEVPRAIYIGFSGDLAVLTIGGQTVTFKNLLAGSLLPCRVARVLSTGSTAGDLIGLS